MVARSLKTLLVLACLFPLLFPTPSLARTQAHWLGSTFLTGYDLQGRTATGTWVHWGTCAVDPSVIPLGAWVHIPGLGECHAEDTGGAIRGRHIDIWRPTASQCYALTGWYRGVWWSWRP